jgi:hypothetical protein
MRCTTAILPSVAEDHCVVVRQVQAICPGPQDGTTDATEFSPSFRRGVELGRRTVAAWSGRIITANLLLRVA